MGIRPMRALSIKLPEADLGRVRAIARRTRSTVSDVIREAIGVYRPDAKGSFGEQAADLIGCVRGPRDLSTNPKHLDDLGE